VAEPDIRRAVAEDVDPAYRILEACKLGPWYDLRLDQFRDWWKSYRAVWVAEAEALVGFSAARSELVEVYVLPERRGHGIGSALLEKAEPALRGPRAEATTRRDEVDGARFLEHHGYTHVAETWLMQTALDREIPEPRWPEGTNVRTFRREEAQAVKDLLDTAYANEPGFRKEPLEEWERFMFGDSSFEPESWFLVEASDGSLAAAALNWKEGFVKDLVVHPAHRRKGLGTELLHHTFRHFQARGLGEVTLKTDSTNTSQAWRLYERVGMRTIQTLDDWVKDLAR
jgi:ribosomal protein S18 acetylase RimI-like enzyme